MKRPDRLVILGSNLTALAVARSARRLGLEPWVVDIAPGPASQSRMARRLVSGSRSRAALLGDISQPGFARGAWLVSTADDWSWEIIGHRRQLEAAYSRILQPANESLAICLSKTAFADWCDEQGIPAPRRYRVDPQTFELIGDVSFPLFVRPAVTQHAGAQGEIAKAREVKGSDELRACLRAFKEAKLAPSISESLLGRNLTQLSVGVAMTGDRAIAMVARKVRPLPTACRVGTLVETTADAEAEELAIAAMRRLRYQGIGEVEILKDVDTGRMYMIEINARPWIQFALAEAAGRDLLGFLLADGCVGVTSAQAHRVWLDFSGDLWNCFNRDDGLVRGQRLRWSDYVRSLLRARVHARWMATDPAPFVADALANARAGLRALLKPRRGTVRTSGEAIARHAGTGK